MSEHRVPEGERERLRAGLEVATDLLAETIHGYKLDAAAHWLLHEGFMADEPPPGSLAALAAPLEDLDA